MQSKNKNNKISRHQTKLRKRLQKLQRQSNQKYHATFFLTILALIILTVLAAYISFQIGYLMGGFKAGAYSSSNLEQPLEENSKEESTLKTQSVPSGDVEAPALKKATFTSYCLRGTMANGEKVHQGAIACSRDIPLGTKIYTSGEIFTCEDRLAKRFDHRFDIWMEDCSKSLDFGKRTLEYKIIKQKIFDLPDLANQKK